MKKLALAGALLAMALSPPAGAVAMPLATVSATASPTFANALQVRYGGRDHHYGWGRGRGRHYGWSRGRHRGWR